MFHLSPYELPANSSSSRLLNTSPCLGPVDQAAPRAVGTNTPTWRSRLPIFSKLPFLGGGAPALCGHSIPFPYKFTNHVGLFPSFAPNMPGACSCLTSIASFFFFCLFLHENSKIPVSRKSENFPDGCTHFAAQGAQPCTGAERGACWALGSRCKGNWGLSGT